LKQNKNKTFQFLFYYSLRLFFLFSKNFLPLSLFYFFPRREFSVLPAMPEDFNEEKNKDYF